MKINKQFYIVSLEKQSCLKATWSTHRLHSQLQGFLLKKLSCTFNLKISFVCCSISKRKALNQSLCHQLRMNKKIQINVQFSSDKLDVLFPPPFIKSWESEKPQKQRTGKAGSIHILHQKICDRNIVEYSYQKGIFFFLPVLSMA